MADQDFKFFGYEDHAVFKEHLQEGIWNSKSSNFETIDETIIDTSRWSIHYEAILKHKPTDTFWRTSYSRGATESQDESPYEYESNIKLTEVELTTKTVEVYVDKA